MTPAQLFARLKKRELAPAYLLLGTEDYERRRVKAALVEAMLGAAPAEDAITQYDLNEAELAAVIDDARSLSLFAAERAILISNAEGVLPKGRAAAAEEESGEDAAAGGAAGLLAAYLRDPSPGVLLVFDAARYDFEGEDKKKLERVRKFYAAIADVIELRRYSAEDARAEAQGLARRMGLRFSEGALDYLVEALGADVSRIANEMEKLALFGGGGRPISEEDITALVPDARSTTIFALVNALGRRDRARSLAILDTLSREGEYLPLALAFLGTQFRMALVAQEANLRSAGQIQGHFSRLGVQMWGSRAEQIGQTVARFSRAQLQRAVRLTYEADKGLRSARPDDRIVMERFVFALTE